MFARAVLRQRKIVRGVEDAAPYSPPQSLPCVKGDSPQCGEMSRSDRGARRVSGWHGVSRDGGIGACMGTLGCSRKATIPQSASLTAPFTQGSLPLRPLFWPRRGQCGGRRKSVKKNAALLHFLAFSLTDHLFGVPRGERLAAHNERRQFAAQTRSCGYSPRWGEHCSLPSFAALNRGPLLATPQSPKPCPAPRK